MMRNVGQLMTSEVVTVGPSTRFKEVVSLMVENGISAIPVVDDERKLLGIVSEEDLLQKEADPGPDDEPLFETKRHRRRRMKAAGSMASEVMTRELITTGPAASVEETARRMSEKHIKRMPVVAEDGRLLGVISRVDLLKVFLRPDGEIRQEVVERVVMPTVNKAALEVTVDVEDGEVILRGHVSRRSLAEGLADFAREIEGVVSIHNGIEWVEDDLVTGSYAWLGTVMAPGRW